MFGLLETVAVVVVSVDFVVRRGHDVWVWLQGAEHTVVATVEKGVDDVKKAL